MTVHRLLLACQAADKNAEVLIRVDVEALEAGGTVFELLSTDFSAGCTDTRALMLDCGLEEEE